MEYKIYRLEDDTKYVKSCLDEGLMLDQALAQLDVLQNEAIQRENEKESKQL